MNGDVQERGELTLDACVRSVGAAVTGGGGELARSAAAGEEEDAAATAIPSSLLRFLARR